MNTKKTVIASILTLTCVAIGAPGCTGEAVAPDATDATEATEATSSALAASGSITTGADNVVIASVVTRAGTKISFVNGDEDDLGTITVGTIGRADPELADAERLRERGIVGFYEALAKQPAPAALREAAARASSGRITTDASDVGETAGTTRGDSLTTASPAPSAATSGLCNISKWVYRGSDSYQHCFLDNFGEPWAKLKEKHFACRFDVVDGPIRVRARSKKSSWKTLFDDFLADGQFMEWDTATQYSKRWRECKTNDNSGHRRHHFRAGGHEKMDPIPYNPAWVRFPVP